MSELDKDILEEYSKHNSLFKTAKKLSVSMEYVNDVIKENNEPEEVNFSLNEEDNLGLDRMRRYLVAKNPATSSWDNTRPEIAEARKKYEEGTHDMVTDRDGDWLLLYSVPLAVKRPKPNYFTPVTEG